MAEPQMHFVLYDIFQPVTKSSRCPLQSGPHYLSAGLSDDIAHSYILFHILRTNFINGNVRILPGK